MVLPRPLLDSSFTASQLELTRCCLKGPKPVTTTVDFESMLQKVKSCCFSLPNNGITIHASVADFLTWGIYFLIEAVQKHARFRGAPPPPPPPVRGRRAPPAAAKWRRLLSARLGALPKRPTDTSVPSSPAGTAGRAPRGRVPNPQFSTGRLR